MNSGAVRCWGSDEYGQLGQGTALRRATPAPVLVPVVVVDDIFADGFDIQSGAPP